MRSGTVPGDRQQHQPADGIFTKRVTTQNPKTGRILTLPPEISPSPRQPSAGRGLGRGASTGLQTGAAVAFRQGGPLSPALSSKGGEGGPVVGWWQCQDALAIPSPHGKTLPQPPGN